MLPSYDIWSIFVTPEKKVFCFTHFSRNYEDFEISRLKNFKNFIAMLKNYLMVIDISGFAA